MKPTLIVLAAAALLAPAAQADGETEICLDENAALENACVYDISEGAPCPHEGEPSDHYTGIYLRGDDVYGAFEGYALCGSDEDDEQTWDDHGAYFRAFVGERFDPIVGASGVWWFFEETDDGEHTESTGIELGLYAPGKFLRLTWESENEECWILVRTQDGVDRLDCPAAPPGPPRVPWGLGLLP